MQVHKALPGTRQILLTDNVLIDSISFPMPVCLVVLEINLVRYLTKNYIQHHILCTHELCYVGCKASSLLLYPTAASPQGAGRTLPPLPAGRKLSINPFRLSFSEPKCARGGHIIFLESIFQHSPHEIVIYSINRKGYNKKVNIL